MKKIILVLIITITGLFGLDEASSLPSDHKQLLDQIITKLKLPNNLSSNKKTKIYNKFSDFLEKGWSTHWLSNSTISKNKIEDSKTQVIDLMVYNNNRVTNITFVYFSKEKQLLTSVKQYIETESSDVMSMYKDMKKNNDYTKEVEDDNYAYFNYKGYTSYNVYHIKSPVGMIVYESSTLLDID